MPGPRSATRSWSTARRHGRSLRRRAPGASASQRHDDQTYRVRVRASDTNSGVRGVQVTANKRKPGKLLRYAAKRKGKRKTVRVKATARPKWIRAKDLAGNLSRWKKLK